MGIKKFIVNDYPNIANEYMKEKNTAPLEDIYVNYPIPVWWKCERGHEWEARVVDRVHGHGCIYCTKRLPIVGENDLATVNPILVREWHPSKNGNLTPQMVTVGSGKKVWWICGRGHEWEASIKDRTRGSSCIYCTKRVPIVGENDLATVNPILAKEWHPSKNGNLTPQMVSCGSGKKVWWKCKRGHEWEASVVNRASNNHGCIYCTRQTPIVGENDLATTNPLLIKEWHPTKNGKLTPQMVMHGSKRKVWWKCTNGHEWEARIYARTYGNKCPYCNDVLPIRGENDFETLHKELALEWHPSKNGDLKPYKVKEKSNKKVWWQCKGGHEWEDYISERVIHNKKCPFCSNIAVIPDKNSFKALQPEAASYWDYEANGDLNPENFFPHSSKEICWTCGKH